MLGVVAAGYASGKWALCPVRHWVPNRIANEEPPKEELL
jgi:hypothetical protein